MLNLGGSPHAINEHPQIHFDTSDGNTCGDWSCQKNIICLAVLSQFFILSFLLTFLTYWQIGDFSWQFRPVAGLWERALSLSQSLPQAGLRISERKEEKWKGHIMTRICSIISICVVFKIGQFARWRIYWDCCVFLFRKHTHCPWNEWDVYLHLRIGFKDWRLL